MVDLKSTKSAHNSILFDFDSLVDIRFGVIRYMRNLYAKYLKSDVFPRYINKNFLLDQSLETLLRERVYSGDNAIISCFNDDFKSSALSIEKEIMENEYEAVLKLSPQTLMVPLIKKYKSMADGAVKTFVFYSKESQLRYLEENHLTTMVRLVDTLPSKINTADYARIIVADYHKFYEFKNLDYESLVVLDFAENFVDPLKYGSLHPDIMRKYPTCEFLVYSSHGIVNPPVG